MIHTAYIVQTNIIPLGNIPFHSSQQFRKAFHNIFQNTECFSDMRFSFPQTSSDSQSQRWQMRPRKRVSSFRSGKRDDNLEYTFPSQPFLKDIGQVYFDTRSVRVGRPRTNTARIRLAALLAKKEEFWNPYKHKNEKTVQIENKNRFFGHDHSIDDQRLNYLHFQTKPLHIKATIENRTIADGKLLIHLYPSGFIVMHIAVSIKVNEDLHPEKIGEFIKECYPLNYDNTWNWESRIIKGKLPFFIKTIKNRIGASLFADSNALLEDGTWYSAVKLIAKPDANNFASFSSLFNGEQFTSFNLGSYKKKSRETPRETSREIMMVSHKKLICLLSPYRKRITSTHFMWSVLYLYHFVLIKSKVYDLYSDFLSREIERLKEYRLSAVSKFTKEDVLNLFVYDPLIPKYLNALDRFIQPAPPFYRALYASISNATGFNEKRNKILDTIKNWESEVEQWEHPIAAAWSKIIAPLRSLFGL